MVDTDGAGGPESHGFDGALTGDSAVLIARA